MSIMTREKKVKRAKTQNDVSSPQPNLNVDFFHVEEQEAKDRSSKEDEALFKGTCGEIQKNIKRIYELKQRGKAQPEIEELRVRTAFLFLQLKKINRLDKHRLKAARDAVCEVLQFLQRESEPRSLCALCANTNQRISPFTPRSQVALAVTSDMASYSLFQMAEACIFPASNAGGRLLVTWGAANLADPANPVYK